jgi:hypothetical protein
MAIVCVFYNTSRRRSRALRHLSGAIVYTLATLECLSVCEQRPLFALDTHLDRAVLGGYLLLGNVVCCALGKVGMHLRERTHAAKAILRRTCTIENSFIIFNDDDFQ